MSKINYETKGSELLNIAGETEISTTPVIINEDWVILVEIYSISDGLVTGKKIWDEETPDSNKTNFYARLLYKGQPGTPPDEAIQVGQHIEFYRCGDYSSQGDEGFELHEENVVKISWVCFVDGNPVIFCRDKGDGTADEVIFDPVTDTWSTPVGFRNKILKAPDPATNFHGGNPPFEADRIYATQCFGNYFVVFLPGHGPVETDFAQTAGDLTFTPEVDGQGNLIDFTVVAAT